MQGTLHASFKRAVIDAVATITGSVILGTVLVVVTGDPWRLAPIAVLAGMVIPAVAVLSIIRRVPSETTDADRITLFRGVLAGGCMTLVALSFGGEVPLRSWPLFVLALTAVLLDAVDGWAARRTDSATAAGGRLDMETDAALLVVLSLPLAVVIGLWVLAIGAMRYAFLAAAWWRPALGQRLAFSQFRRVVAGAQGIVLAVSVLPVLPVTIASVAVMVALILLLVSFGKDVIALERSWRLDGSDDTPSRVMGQKP